MTYLLTKEELDALQNSYKGAVRAASLADVDLGLTHTVIDGVALADGDKVLLKDQSTTSEVGVYVWSSGTQMFTRSDDFLTGKVESALVISVKEGTQATTLWQLATPDPITVGVTGLAFLMAGGGGGSDLATTLASGNSTSGTDIEVTGGDAITAPDGIDLDIETLDGTGASGALNLSSGAAAGGGTAGDVNITSGAGDGVGDGGAVNITSGDGGATAADGGDIIVNSGDGGAGGGQGGRITLQGGVGSAGGVGGSVDILGGNAGVGATGGGVFIKAETGATQVRIETASGTGSIAAINILGGDSSSGVNPGGDINITAGDNTNASSGGDIDITAGNGSGGGGGGDVGITAGNGSDATSGGEVLITAGTGGGTDATGGDIVVTAGTGGATNGDGGNLRLVPGAAAGSGADGEIQSEGLHRMESHIVFDEIAEPSTAAGEGTIFISDGSGSLINNGAYYRRESDGSSIRFDVVEPWELSVAGKTEVDGVTAETPAGQFIFDTSDYTNYTTFIFRAVLSVSDTGLEGEVYLYNITDDEEVTDSRQSVTGAGSDTPDKVEGTLTAGAAAGNLQNTEKIYEVRITNDGSLGSDLTYLGGAFMRLEE